MVFGGHDVAGWKDQRNGSGSAIASGAAQLGHFGRRSVRFSASQGAGIVLQFLFGGFGRAHVDHDSS
jgi:hypothetical protein